MTTEKLTTINKTNSRASVAAGGLSTEVVALTRAPRITGVGGGKSRGFGYDRAERSPERIAKAQAFAERIKAQRADKSRCPRCGCPRGEQFRTCENCRAKIRRAKLRREGVAVLKGGEYSNADLAAMVLQMRREMDRMQTRFKTWQKAAHYRATLRWRTNKMRRKNFRPVSEAEAMDYLRETNHAYAAEN